MTKPQVEGRTENLEGSSVGEAAPPEALPVISNKSVQTPDRAGEVRETIPNRLQTIQSWLTASMQNLGRAIWAATKEWYQRFELLVAFLIELVLGSWLINLAMVALVRGTARINTWLPEGQTSWLYETFTKIDDGVTLVMVVLYLLYEVNKLRGNLRLEREKDFIRREHERQAYARQLNEQEGNR